MVVHAHSVELKLANGGLPTEFRLFALGKNETSKGTFVLDEAGMAEIMAAYREQGHELSFDYEHQALKTVGASPAAAWFVPESRADGLWAVNVRWTERAASLLSAKEYRHFSPAFATDKQGRITRLVNVALTNLPATKNQAPLVAAKNAPANASAQETSMSFAPSIVGLKDDAPEADVEGRIVALAQTEARLLEITGKDNVGDAMGVVVSAKDNAVKLAAAEKQLAEWQQVHATAEQNERNKQIALLVDAAADKKHYGLPRDEFKAILRGHGEQYGVEALVKLVATYSDKVRAYTPPVMANSVEAQRRAIEDYQKAHPGVSFGEAYVKLAAERPSLFSEVR